MLVVKKKSIEEKKEKLSQIPRKLYVVKSGQVEESVTVLKEAREIFHELDKANWQYKGCAKEIDQFIDKNEELIKNKNSVQY